MLTDEESEWLAEEDFDGEVLDDDAPEYEMADDLERCGRAEWRTHPYREELFHSFTTEMGHKALRIDALMREKGWVT